MAPPRFPKGRAPQVVLFEHGLRRCELDHDFAVTKLYRSDKLFVTAQFNEQARELIKA